MNYYTAKVFENLQPQDELCLFNENITKKIIRFQSHFPKEPNNNVLVENNMDKKELIKQFYEITKINPLEFYADDIEIKCVEKGLYDDEKQNSYIPDTQIGGNGYILLIFLPVILVQSIAFTTYNAGKYIHNLIQYQDNPIHYFFTGMIELRKSMVSKK